ncbi:hypothetical protein NHQ30_008281 [Ciborinia camelliae]|nr:hypothetical protein NHQ30_008281 [Ciborinia camelliae]
MITPWPLTVEGEDDAEIQDQMRVVRGKAAKRRARNKMSRARLDVAASQCQSFKILPQPLTVPPKDKKIEYATPKKRKFQERREETITIKIAEEFKCRRLTDLEKIGQMVELDVGSVVHNRRIFPVHKALLCNTVKYFDEIFKSHPMDIPTYQLRLDQQEPISFALFVDWLYYGRYATLNIADGEIAFTSRIRLYCLAVDFQLLELMDYTMSVLISNREYYGWWRPTLEDSHAVYLDTHPGSKLRSFISHSLVTSFAKSLDLNDPSMMTNELGSIMEIDNQDLFVDMVGWINRIQEGDMRDQDQFPNSSLEPSALSKCSFHVHPEKAPCSFTGDIF